MALDSVVLATAAELRCEQLDSAPELFGRRPLACVSRCAKAPTLDGTPDDACWQQTVACSGFVALGSTQSAKAATAVRFCYDAANLYALVECQEPILVTAQQRRHEFKAKVTERDGDVCADDSAVLLLDPAADGQHVYDFTLNSLGTVADALDTAPDWWSTRDLTWNSSARAAGAVEEGKWYVEMVVPLSELGGVPEPGHAWHASLGRIAACRKEVSTWNLCGAGIHAPVAPGALIFLDSSPGVKVQAPPDLQLGRNRLTALLSSPGLGGVYFYTRLASPALSAGHISYFADDLKEAGQEFEISAGGDVRMAHAVLDAATLQPLYLTPEVARGVRSSLAVLKSCQSH